MAPHQKLDTSFDTESRGAKRRNREGGSRNHRKSVYGKARSKGSFKGERTERIVGGGGSIKD